MFLRVTLLKVIVLSIFLEKCEIFKALIQTVGVYLTSFTDFFSGDLKKKLLKKRKNSFFVLPTLKSENQLIKKF